MPFVNSYRFADNGGGLPPVIGTTLTTSTGTSNLLDYPVEGLYNYSLSISIIPQSFIGNGQKQINKIGWDTNGWSSGYTVINQRIFLAHTSLSSVGGTWNSFVTNSCSDFTEVKTSSVVIFSGSGTTTVTFDTNFYYNGTDNLAILWENGDGSWSSGYGWTESVTTSNQATKTVYSDSTNSTDLKNSTLNGGYLRIPNLIIHY